MIVVVQTTQVYKCDIPSKESEIVIYNEQTNDYLICLNMNSELTDKIGSRWVNNFNEVVQDIYFEG